LKPCFEFKQSNLEKLNKCVIELNSTVELEAVT